MKRDDVKTLGEALILGQVLMGVGVWIVWSLGAALVTLGAIWIALVLWGAILVAKEQG